jgi:hypothetical protein
MNYQEERKTDTYETHQGHEDHHEEVHEDHHREDEPQSQEQVYEPEVVEPEEPGLSLEEYVTEYEQHDTEDKQLDDQIEQLASDEKFEEADNASARQTELRARKEEILNKLRGMGFESFEEAKAKVGPQVTSNENQEEGHVEEVPEEKQEEKVEEKVEEETPVEEPVNDENDAQIKNEEEGETQTGDDQE